jgi:4-oxalocrotonate tautomerase
MGRIIRTLYTENLYTISKRITEGGKGMPLVTIKIIEGRTVEQKRGMAKDVTEAIARNIGCPTQAVSIDIMEYGKENLATGGELFIDTR